MQNVREAMGKLYAMAIGVNREKDAMDIIIKANLESLAKSERDSYIIKNSLISYSWIPFIVVGFGLIMYIVTALVVSLQNIAGMVQ